MVVRKESETNKIHLAEIDTIMLETNQVYISAYLLAELAKHKIPLSVTDEKHNPVGHYLPIYGAHNVSKRVKQQLEWGASIKKRVWQKIVRDKIHQQARVLEDYGFSEAAAAIYQRKEEVKSGDTTNREAHAARIYFATLFGMEFARGHDSPINAALNYGYAVLLSTVSREIVSRGYLTQQGICHHSEFNQFNLSCDFMEPFRPIVDRIVLENEELGFCKELRYLLANILNREAAYQGGTYKLSSVISLYIQDCLRVLGKKMALEDVQDFEFL